MDLIRWLFGQEPVEVYAKGTRGSDESALGAVGRETITDNTSSWSGDHCMDHRTVPGILLTSRPFLAIIVFLIWVPALIFSGGLTHPMFVLLAWLIIFQSRERREMRD